MTSTRTCGKRGSSVHCRAGSGGGVCSGQWAQLRRKLGGASFQQTWQCGSTWDTHSAIWRTHTYTAHEESRLGIMLEKNSHNNMTSTYRIVNFVQLKCDTAGCKTSVFEFIPVAAWEEGSEDIPEVIWISWVPVSWLDVASPSTAWNTDFI